MTERDRLATDLPERVIVDQHGHYWRDFGDALSMPPVSDENTATDAVATYTVAHDHPCICTPEGQERLARALTFVRVGVTAETEPWPLANPARFAIAIAKAYREDAG